MQSATYWAGDDITSIPELIFWGTFLISLFLLHEYLPTRSR